MTPNDVALLDLIDPDVAAEARKKLALAMIRQATLDLAQLSDRALAIEACRWFLADDDELPGFVWCCHTLGLRHTIVRDTVLDEPDSVARLLTGLAITHGKTVAA